MGVNYQKRPEKEDPSRPAGGIEKTPPLTTGKVSILPGDFRKDYTWDSVTFPDGA